MDHVAKGHQLADVAAIIGTMDPGNERGVELGRVILERGLSSLTAMECGSLLKELKLG